LDVGPPEGLTGGTLSTLAAIEHFRGPPCTLTGQLSFSLTALDGQLLSAVDGNPASVTIEATLGVGATVVIPWTWGGCERDTPGRFSASFGSLHDQHRAGHPVSCDGGRRSSELGSPKLKADGSLKFKPAGLPVDAELTDDDASYRAAVRRTPTAEEAP
jgi:hypothetical protein